jgi:hypothetical protein
VACSQPDQARVEVNLRPLDLGQPLPRFPVRLQAVALVLQNVRNRTGADRVPLAAQLFASFAVLLGD